MGTWGVEPFDSDHAADFAAGVIGSSGPEERRDLVQITFNAFMGTPDDDPYLASMEEGYELPSVVLEVIASAAYVHGAVSGDTRYTESVYARGVDDESDDLGPIPDLGEIPPSLVADAHAALTRCIRLMREHRIGPMWSEPSEWLAVQLRTAMQ